MVEKIFQALSDEGRRQILLLLAGGDKTTTQICQHFDYSRQAVNKHLALLEEGGLILAYADGSSKRYALRAEKLKPVKKWLKELVEKSEKHNTKKPLPAKQIRK